MGRGALLGASAWLTAACGGSYESRPIAEFPNAGALAAIGAKPAPRPELPKLAGNVDAWTIEEAPVADAVEAQLSPVGPWESLFVEVAGRAAKPPRLTLAMSCYARELGRFLLEHKALPGDELRLFLAGACGTHIPEVNILHGAHEVPPALGEQELFAEMKDGLRGQLEKAVGKGEDVAGFWFGRREGKTVTVVLTGVDKAQWKPFSLVPDAKGEVTIEGRLKEPVQSFSAYINHGRAGVEDCHIDLNVAPPAFRFVCRAAPDDKTAWVQLTFTPPKRLLTTPFAQILVRRSPDVTPDYAPTPYAQPRPVKSPEAFTQAAFEQLNQARKAARLPPVTLAQKESATAAKLAPHYFGAVLGGGNPADADVIALGLLAGWDVGGMIRDATLVSALEPTLDAGRWLNAALEMPMGRRTLFAPAIEQVAFGPLVTADANAAGAIGAIVTGYRFHRSADHTDDVNMLITRVVRSRRELGLSAPKRLATMPEAMKSELADVHAGKASPEDALHNVLETAVGRFSRDMRGYVIEASSLDELRIPEEVLRQPTLHMDIGVTHYKAPGAAWAQYAILVVYAAYTEGEGDGGGSASMQASSPRKGKERAALDKARGAL